MTFDYIMSLFLVLVPLEVIWGTDFEFDIRLASICSK